MLETKRLTLRKPQAADIPAWSAFFQTDRARFIALAERLGAVRDDAAERPDPEDLVYRHPAPEAA